jgi:hypothetical protein
LLCYNERKRKKNRVRLIVDVSFFLCVEQQADELHNIGDALRMSCVGTKTPPSDAASAATTTTLVISSAATTTTPSDAKSINLPAPPVKNGHTTTWVSFSSVSVQLFLFFSDNFLYDCKLVAYPTLRTDPFNRILFFPHWFMTDEAISRQESATEQGQQSPEVGGRGPGEQSGRDEQMQVQ